MWLVPEVLVMRLVEDLSDAIPGTLATISIVFGGSSLSSSCTGTRGDGCSCKKQTSTEDESGEREGVAYISRGRGDNCIDGELVGK